MADQKPVLKDANPAPKEKADLSNTELDAVSGGGWHENINNANNRSGSLGRSRIYFRLAPGSWTGTCGEVLMTFGAPSA